MSRRVHVALYGFSEDERKALDACFRAEPDRQPSYATVASLDDADCIVADASEPLIIAGVEQAQREADTVYVGDAAPAGAGALVQAPIDSRRVLAALDALAARRPPPVPELTLVIEPPELDDSVDVEGWRPYRSSSTPPFPSVEAPPRDRRSAKSAARAAARRARMAHSPADTVQCEDVLILDDSEIARAFLSRLVRVFGFKPHAVASSFQALDLLERQPFAATFLDVVLAEDDDADGLALCQRIKSAPLRPGHSAPAVVMVSGQAQPSDRVRAKLAGCDVFLPKPLSRGDIARALEDCGVPFPADERRR